MEDDIVKNNRWIIIWLYIIFLIIIIGTIFTPCLANLSPYMLANYDVKCDKNIDKCFVNLKNTNIKVKEFKISNIKEITIKTHLFRYHGNKICINCPEDWDLHKYEQMIIIKNDNSKMIVGGLLAKDRNDKNFSKFNNFLNSKQSYLSYTTSNPASKQFFDIYSALFAVLSAIYIFIMILSVIFLFGEDIDIYIKKIIKLIMLNMSIVYVIYFLLCFILS